MKRPLVFIIDDDDAIREAFTDVLTEYGYQTQVYRNGREAAEALERSERPDLILLDWMMPEMSGSEFVEKERARLDAIPLVVISAVADTIGDIPGVRARMGKPLDISELLHAVDRHCEPGREELREA